MSDHVPPSPAAKQRASETIEGQRSNSKKAGNLCLIMNKLLGFTTTVKTLLEVSEGEDENHAGLEKL